MEPIAILIIAVNMCLVSGVVIVAAIQRIINYATDDDVQGPQVELGTIIIMLFTIGT